MTYSHERLPLHNDDKVFTWWQVIDDLQKAIVYVVAALAANIFCIEGALIVSDSFGKVNGLTLGVVGSSCLLFLLLEYLKSLKSVVGRFGRCFAMVTQALCMIVIELAIVFRLLHSVGSKTCESQKLPYALPYPCERWSLKKCYLRKISVPCSISRVGIGVVAATEMLFLSALFLISAP